MKTIKLLFLLSIFVVSLAYADPDVTCPLLFKPDGVTHFFFVKSLHVVTYMIDKGDMTGDYKQGKGIQCTYSVYTGMPPSGIKNAQMVFYADNYVAGEKNNSPGTYYPMDTMPKRYYEKADTSHEGTAYFHFIFTPLKTNPEPFMSVKCEISSFKNS